MTIRRPSRISSPSKEGPKANEDIRAPEVQLIDIEGKNIGVISTQEALKLAFDSGLDLVEIVPNAEPPVCKIIDLGKLKYQNQKKAAEARRKQKIVDIKEIKMRPNIDQHDYDVKMKAIRRFFEDGDKVKITLRFRGREIAHQNLGMQLFIRIKDDLFDVSKVELEPKMEGRQAIMILIPR